MSNYTDAVLRAITKNCRTEIRKEFRDQVAEIPKLKKKITNLNREIRKLKVENSKFKWRNSKIEEIERYIVEEYDRLKKAKDSLENGSFTIKFSSYLPRATWREINKNAGFRRRISNLRKKQENEK